jgi:hypothetical protein
VGDLDQMGAVSQTSGEHQGSATEHRSGLTLTWTRIRAVVNDPDLREDGEPAPSAATIGALSDLLHEAAYRMETAFPPGDVSTHFGEISIEWRSADRFLRLAFSPGVSVLCRLDWGIQQRGSLGQFQHMEGVDASVLASKLHWLNGSR